jgi:hypothetical protein
MDNNHSEERLITVLEKLCQEITSFDINLWSLKSFNKILRQLENKINSFDDVNIWNSKNLINIRDSLTTALIAKSKLISFKINQPDEAVELLESIQDLPVTNEIIAKLNESLNKIKRTGEKQEITTDPQNNDYKERWKLEAKKSERRSNIWGCLSVILIPIAWLIIYMTYSAIFPYDCEKEKQKSLIDVKSWLETETSKENAEYARQQIDGKADQFTHQMNLDGLESK